MDIKAFKGYRPRPDVAAKVALIPNNLYNEPERIAAYRKNQYSFAHVVKPRIDFDNEIHKTDQQVFDHATRYFDVMFQTGVLVRDEKPSLYIIRMTMGNNSQTGLICCMSVKDYDAGHIKKHEDTRAEKEKENLMHLETTRLNSNPVFLTYRQQSEIDETIEKISEASKPAYDFIGENAVRQQVWVVSAEEEIDLLSSLFSEQVKTTYIADGHHRTVAASLYAKKISDEENFDPKSKDYKYFLCCLFPSNQLKIYAYNRLVKNLNNMSQESFLHAVGECFEIKPASRSPYDPQKPHRFGMFIGDKWFKLKVREGSYKKDPVSRLDVDILQQQILDPVLRIKDPRIDKRIDFIPEVNGLKELERAVNRRGSGVAFSLYPVSMEQLLAVSDAGEMMPPKSTWFEPKLLSGLIIFRSEF